MELLNIYLKEQYSTDDPISVEDLSNLYLRFYSTVRAAESTNHRNLIDYLPEELQEIVRR